MLRVYFTTKLFKNRQHLTPSKSLCSTSFGTPTTSKNSLHEYWALAQHWRSMFTSLLDNSEFNFFVTTRSEFKNLLYNLRISSNTSALIADILDSTASTIAIKSFFSTLSKFYSVYDDIV